MKLSKRSKIPFKPEEQVIHHPSQIGSYAHSDYENVEKMIKEGKIDQLQALINERMAPFEEQYADGQAGLPTRDYLTTLFGKSILKQNPEFKGHSQTDEETRLKMMKQFKDKFYPGLDDALKAHDLPTNMTSDPYKGSRYSVGKEGMNWGIGGDEAENMGVLAHELGHATDFVGERAAQLQNRDPESIEAKASKAALEKLLAKKPAYKKVLDEPAQVHRHLTTGEGGYNNPRIPNFGDYDWEEGDFDSDWMRAPLDIQNETGEDHHAGRNFPLDNLIENVTGGPDKVVEATKFNKLKKMLG